MALRLVQIAMNARDDDAVGRFWADALGWGVDREGPGATNVAPVGLPYPDPAAVVIDVLAVPEPKTVKNRVHIDLATTSAADQADLVARLEGLGATAADVGQGTSPGPFLPIPRATSSACSSLERSTGTPDRLPRWSSTAPIRGAWPVSGARQWTGSSTR